MKVESKSGFTLVEIMVVVVIVGLLASLALPAFNAARTRTQNALWLKEVRVFAEAIEVFATELGYYPEDSSTGNIPTGLEDYIDSARWNAGPEFGGEWDVEKDTSGILSAVGVHRYTVSEEQLELFDRVHDDGDLATGRYRKIGPERYYYVIDD